MSTERIIQPLRKSWSRKQKRLHNKLILAHREKELLWYLGLFLAVHHPEWAEKEFVEKFKNNLITIKQCFARAIVCGGVVGYFETFPYNDDLQKFIGNIRYKLYIKITPDMYFKDVMKLQRSFDLSPIERREFITKVNAK